MFRQDVVGSAGGVERAESAPGLDQPSEKPELPGQVLGDEMGGHVPDGPAGAQALGPPLGAAEPAQKFDELVVLGPQQVSYGGPVDSGSGCGHVRHDDQVRGNVTLAMASPRPAAATGSAAASGLCGRAAIT